jgi:hypothetical protein
MTPADLPAAAAGLRLGGQPAQRRRAQVAQSPYITVHCMHCLLICIDCSSSAVLLLRRMHPSACRIFSAETGPDGRRCFMVTTYAKFWQRYSGMLPQHRHYYEIIRQGWPCHLYFGALLVTLSCTHAAARRLGISIPLTHQCHSCRSGVPSGAQ